MPTRTRTISRSWLVAATLLNLALIIALCVMAPPAYPLSHDIPANFWFATTGVDLGATRRRQDAVILDFDRFIYSSQYPFPVYPDYTYQTISIEEAEPDLPAVARQLARRAAINDPNDYVAKAYTQWIALNRGPLAAFPPVNDLLLCIDQTRSECINHLPPAPGVSKWAPPAQYANFQNGLLHVASAARIFWATFTFEILFFSFLIWFTLWPFIHREHLRRKLIRITLFPLLLYLPSWFSYSNPATPFLLNDAFSSTPMGGILYPYSQYGVFLAPVSRLVGEDTQLLLLEHIPPFLAPITQGRAATFPSYHRLHIAPPIQVLPLDTLCMSLEFLLLASIAVLINRLRSRAIRRPGFPVEIQTPPHLGT